MAREEVEVVLVPWLAFGHMMPFFQLSIALAEAGIHTSLVSTTKNIQRLPELAPHHLAAGFIDLVALPLPAIDRNLLPEDAEATVDIPFEKIQYLKVAFDLLKDPFKQLIANHSPSWIISDIICPSWMPEVAQEFNIPLVTFYAFSAAATVFIGPPEFLVGEGQEKARGSPESLTTKPIWVDFPSTIAYRRDEASVMHAGFYGQNASGTTDAQRVASVVHASRAVAIRSSPEFESDYFNIQAKITGKPAIPVGFLPPQRSTETKITESSWIQSFKWLDEQKPRSVVFVGFGSECKVSKDQISEIACGLELSGLPFLWALRKPSWATDEAEALPSGFCSRVAGKGVVHIGWAPQKEILAHSSVGGSLFHAGWGSVIETLQHGHCQVVLPFIIDQGLNSRMLVEKGLAIEVERSEDGSYSKNDIAKSLRQAMISIEGEALRARAKEAAALFGDEKLKQGYIESFAAYLKRGVGI